MPRLRLRRRFQFTHPVRGATFRRPRDASPAEVSIHAPRAGCDIRLLRQILVQSAVSIHAPRAGCDPQLRLVYNKGLFQFTHPVRGATCIFVGANAPNGRFNSRTPCGVRLESVKSDAPLLTFQFTHPVRGATPRASPAQPPPRVSIHAPRAGCDITTMIYYKLKEMFQFTHPVRGAT